MLERAVACLSVVHGAGGHGHLEQPASAMSWETPEVLSWLRQGSCSLVHLAACGFGKNWHKSWLFASSFPPLSSMACVCSHGQGAHESVTGIGSDGEFRSRKTAMYPPKLASEFASIIDPLLSSGSASLSLSEARASSVQKPLVAPPWGRVDGGGRVSQPDWSAPRSPNKLGLLRKGLLDYVGSVHAARRLVQHALSHSDEPLFTANEVSAARSHFFEWLGAPPPADTWHVREHQPFMLNALHALSLFVADPDITLFPALKEGAPTGFQHDIPQSFVFSERLDSPLDEQELSQHTCNWKSVEDDVELAAALLAEELEQGFCFEFAGSLEEARAAYLLGVALGKLGLVKAPFRKPRLVLDNSICGTNANCFIPEKQRMPSVHDVMNSLPLRGSHSMLSALTLDVKQAHKRIFIRESEHGLLGFTLKNKIFFYRVAPFGATFAQHWWGRMGSFLLRMIHLLIWVAHAALLFVDDFFVAQDKSVLPATGAMICLFFQILGVPLSWKKLMFGVRVSWIGWEFNMAAMSVSLQPTKRSKLLDLIDRLRRHPRTSVKDLERFIGLALWACNLFPVMKSQLHYLYKDLFSPGASHFSVGPDYWPEVKDCLRQDLRFFRTPPGTAIPVNSKLLSIRHKELSSLADLEQIIVQDKRLWLRVVNPKSSRRRLSKDSLRVLRNFQDWLQ